MSDPGSPSGAVAETTTTTGTGPYQLNPNSPNALSAYFRFADVFADGATITYEVDDTQSKEIVTGTFHLMANTLSRDTVLFSSNANALVDWPVTGQRTVRPLVGFPLCDKPPMNKDVLTWDAVRMLYCPAPGLPLCATPPMAGQTLVWDAVNNEWCPGTPAGGGSLTLCATPAWDGADLAWNAANNDWCPDSRVFGMPGGTTGGTPSTSSDVTLAAADQSGAGDAGNINVTAGSVQPATGLNGGGINLTAGNGDLANGTGGAIHIKGGVAGDNGGTIYILAGDSPPDGMGGDVRIFAGGGALASGTADIGGAVGIAGGGGQFHGGRVGIGGGVAFDGSGGEVNIGGGNAGNSGIGGAVTLSGGSGIGGGDSGNIFLSMAPVLSGAGQMGVIQIVGFPTGIIPSSNPPPHNFYLYVNPAGNLEIRGSAGTVTTLAVP